MQPAVPLRSERSPTFYFEIFTTSLAAILLEIAYTRIFSFKVFYYFTYLIIGLGLLGIGSGGVVVATSLRLKRADPAALVRTLCLAGGLSIAAGYFVIAPLQLNVARLLSEPAEMLKLISVCILLTLPFLCVGIVISTILGSRPASASRLYGTDLLGAGLGCMLCVPLLGSIGPPRTIALAGAVLAAGAIPLARESRKLLVAASVIVLALAVPVAMGDLLKDPTVAAGKTLEDYRKADLVRFSKWNPVFRIDVVDHPFHPGEMFIIYHDGQPGSGMRRFEGDLSKFDYLDKDPRALPFEVLPPNPKVLIIGAAGGHEVLASLYFDAEHVTGVELNPVTYSLLTDVYADITGHLPEREDVTLLNGDGRWFLKQSEEKYDLIWFVAPDSYAAMNASTSGAFVLSESYLYTVEMLEQSLKHLTDRGIVCTQFGEIDYFNRPNRTTRYLATARAALQETAVGRVDDFRKHLLVSSATGFPPFLETVVLIGKQPFSETQVQKFLHKNQSVDGGIVRFFPGREPDPTPVSQVVAVSDEELEPWLQQHRYQVDAVRDDSPFFWHFARFRDAIAAPLPHEGVIVDYEDVIAEQVTLIFLFIVTILAAILLLLPLRVMKSVWKEVPFKAPAAIYFATLGVGFMFLEVALIQKLTLFLGYPTYSLSVTLFGILVFSGIGSLLSGRVVVKGAHKALGVALAILVVLVGTYQLVLPALIDHFIGHSIPVRIGLTVLLIAPVGLCLGLFMPLGLRTVAATTPHAREYVAWAWALNGFFSVIASILSTILAMVIGFRLLMLVALGVYGLGVAALTRIPVSTPEPDPASG